MARNLDRVLTCIRVRRAEYGHEYLVDNIAIRVDDIAECEGVSLALGQRKTGADRTEYPIGYTYGFGA